MDPLSPDEEPTLSQEEEQKGTRQAMTWGAAIAVVLFAVVLAWGLVVLPRSERDTANRQSAAAIGTTANQGAPGESAAAKNGAVMPNTPENGAGPERK